MNTSFTVYDEATGRILRTGRSKVTQAGDGEAELREIEADALTQYVRLLPTVEVIARPDNTTELASGDETITADDVDEANFSSIPAGSTYELIGPILDAGDVSGTTLAFTTDTAGTYTITFRSFPELDVSFEVVAS